MKKSGSIKEKWFTPYVMLLPAFLIYTWIVVQPIIQVFLLSFQKWNGVTTIPKKFIGLQNYQRIFDNPMFFKAFGNTIIWVFLIVVCTVAIGFVVAYLLSQNIKGRTFFQTVYFLPVLQAFMSTAVIWRWIYQPNGALNALLSQIVGSEVLIGYLGDKTLALPSLAIAHIWSQLGLSIVLFLTGLQTIDTSLYEAADIDGAGFWQKFRFITIPSMVSTTATVVIMMMTGAAKSFDLIKATTDGGPNGATEILATLTYKIGMVQSNYGEGSALAMCLLLIILPLTIIYYRQQQKKEV